MQLRMAEVTRNQMETLTAPQQITIAPLSQESDPHTHDLTSLQVVGVTGHLYLVSYINKQHGAYKLRGHLDLQSRNSKLQVKYKKKKTR